MDSWLLHMCRFPTSTDTKMKGRKKIQRMNSSLAKELSQPTGRSICLFIISSIEIIKRKKKSFSK